MLHRVVGVAFEATLRVLFGSTGVSETREDAARWLMQREVKFVYQPAIVVEFRGSTGGSICLDAAE